MHSMANKFAKHTGEASVHFSGGFGRPPDVVNQALWLFCDVVAQSNTLIRKRNSLQVILADEQKTARVRPDRGYGNSVLPRRRLVEFPGRILFPSDESTTRPRQ